MRDSVCSPRHVLAADAFNRCSLRTNCTNADRIDCAPRVHVTGNAGHSVDRHQRPHGAIHAASSVCV